MSKVEQIGLAIPFLGSPVCPCCGAQQLLGVWLPRGQADILRKVMRAGAAGYAASDWDGIRRPGRRVTFRVHVYQLNSRLEETDWRVRGSGGREQYGGGRYRLVKVR